MKRIRVMAFGTFDLFHKGHEKFLEQARTRYPDCYLIVSVARDSAVRRIKGAAPLHNEEQRCVLVQTFGHPDEVVLGNEVGYMDHIIAARPDIIVLGYDQASEYVDNLERDLRAADLTTEVVRLAAFEPDVYKTSKLRS